MSLSEIIPLLLLLFDDIVVVGALFTVVSPLLWLEKVEFISLLFNLILMLSFVLYTICVGLWVCSGFLLSSAALLCSMSSKLLPFSYVCGYRLGLVSYFHLL